MFGARASSYAAAGGAPFAPTDIAGLAVWFDASDTATITDAGSGAVSQWADKSGNARHASQGTAAARPITGTRTLNGLNALDFDGNDYLDTGSFTLAQPLTVMFVIILDNTTAKHVFSSVGGNLQAGYGSGTTNRFYAGSAEIGAPNNTLNARQESYVFNGASSASWLDGAAGGTGNPGSSGTTTGFRLGRERNLTGNGINGLLAEVVVYGSALSAGDRQAVEDYLAAKWGTP